MATRQNIVGEQIRRIRYQKGWTQEVLAARLATVGGWDISRGTLSKIEAGLRCVTDRELVIFTKVLGVSPEQLLPKDTKPRQRA